MGAVTITPTDLKRGLSLKRINQTRQVPRVLICPSGFKESLQPAEVADCIEAGVLRAVPQAKVIKAPLVDGGEGFTKALCTLTLGEIQHLEVMGPVRQPVASHFGFLGNVEQKTAVIEMAAAAGLSLVPSDQRNPLYTTTYGVGQLIKAALDDGAEKILIGCGDSGTCDGGIGMAQALGAVFYDSNGEEIPVAQGGASLTRLARADLSNLHPRLAEVSIDVACNWHNILCGPSGVARIFGPQKGATETEVELLSSIMDSVASITSSRLGHDISLSPGTGASGGLGAGLLLLGATLHPRFEILQNYLKITSLITSSDLIITAEGGIDSQTPHDKIPSFIARIAKSHSIPVIALAGTVGVGAEECYGVGIDAFASILQGPVNLATAIAQAERLVKDAAESAMRMVMVGWQLKRSMMPRFNEGVKAREPEVRVLVRRTRTFNY